MHGLLPALALVIGGIIGAVGANAVIAWVCVGLAGLFMLIPV
jgi:hypothetical protein